MIGVGIDDQPGVGQVLLQGERVAGRDDHIVAALHDQRGLVDLLEIVQHML
jgi:hypothetical protein